jgi:predicted permease
MTWRALWLRWRALIWPRRAEHELAEELDFHIEMQARKHRTAGVDGDEAIRRARLEFGNSTLVKDDARDVRALPFVDETLRNVRYAVRSLRRAPAFTLAVVVTIGLGVGLNATMFTVFDAYVLRPFDVRDPYSLYSVSWMDRTGHFHDFSPPEYDAVRRPNAIFADVVAFHSVTARLNAVAATGDAVTDNYFLALGVHPALGRLLLPDDRGVAVVVLGHSAWQRRFGGDSSIIGRRVPLRGHPFQIVGVAQPGFEGLFKKPRDFWVPLGTLSAFDSLPTGDNEWMSLIARLRHGVSPAQGEAFVTSSLTGPTALLPDSAHVARASLTSRASALPKTLTSYVIFAPLALAFGLILMLACANVANMLLARGVARQRELGTRLALGAGRAQLMRQLVTECVVLVLPAAALGYVIAWIVIEIGLRTLFATLPADLAAFVRVVPIHPDPRVAVFAVAAALASALLFGLAPSLQSTRFDLVRATRGNVASDITPRRSRGALVVSQIVVASLLLIVAGILLREAARFGKLGTGLRTTDVVSIETQPSFQPAVLASLGGGTLVDGAAAAASLPLDMRFPTIAMTPTDGSASVAMQYNRVSPSYFGVLQIDVVSGRGFMPGEEGTAVAIVSEAAARELWPGKNPLDRVLHLQLEHANRRANPIDVYQNARVVGVARNVAVNSVERGTDQPVVYFPMATHAAGCCLLVRVRGEPAKAKTLLDAMLDRDVPGGVDRIDRLESFVAGAVYPYRAAYWVALVLGLTALMLTMAGVYGVVAYLVRQRTQEIGIRIALGATTWNVLRLVVAQSLRHALIGGAVGSVLALGVARLLAANVQSMPTFDVIAFAGAFASVLTACMIAALVPSWHAVRIDPALSLRHDC